MGKRKKENGAHAAGQGNDRKQDKIVSMKELQEREATFSYDDEEESGEERLKKIRVPKAVYSVAVILLALVLGLILWLNRENLTPDRIWNWVRLQTEGTGTGDGFPVPLTGSLIREQNFLSDNGLLLELSDTALTEINSTGKQLWSARHSFSEPVLRTASGKYLIYHMDGSGYLTLSGQDTVVNGQAPKDIITGKIAKNGRYALGMKSADGASQLEVYEAKGEVQYQYQFAREYITALALDKDATHAAVATVRTELGELVSKITVLDLNQTEPVATYESRGNLILDLSWTGNGIICGVGDAALVRAKSDSMQFEEYSYGGKQVTAYSLVENKVFVSVSSYERAGASTLLAFGGMEEPLVVEETGRISSISSYGAVVGMLVDQQLVVCDASTGTELGRIAVANDSRTVAMINERSAYVLGVGEIRLAVLE